MHAFLDIFLLVLCSKMMKSRSGLLSEASHFLPCAPSLTEDNSSKQPEERERRTLLLALSALVLGRRSQAPERVRCPLLHQPLRTSSRSSPRSALLSSA